MRKIYVYKDEDLKDLDYPGWFHQWDIQPGYEMDFAVVEKVDGTVKWAKASIVKFEPYSESREMGCKSI